MKTHSPEFSSLNGRCRLSLIRLVARLMKTYSPEFSSLNGRCRLSLIRLVARLMKTYSPEFSFLNGRCRLSLIRLVARLMKTYSPEFSFLNGRCCLSLIRLVARPMKTHSPGFSSQRSLPLVAHQTCGSTDEDSQSWVLISTVAAARRSSDLWLDRWRLTVLDLRVRVTPIMHQDPFYLSTC
jgi:hypothetical protein